jgi:hypothetical protein
MKEMPHLNFFHEGMHEGCTKTLRNWESDEAYPGGFTVYSLTNCNSLLFLVIQLCVLV